MKQRYRESQISKLSLPVSGLISLPIILRDKLQKARIKFVGELIGKHSTFLCSNGLTEADLLRVHALLEGLQLPIYDLELHNRWIRECYPGLHAQLSGQGWDISALSEMFAQFGFSDLETAFDHLRRHYPGLSIAREI